MATLLVVVSLAGCAAQKAYQRAERDMRRENFDQAVLGYSKALSIQPGNTRYAVALERAKLKASSDHFQKGRRYHEAGLLELAIAEYEQTLLLNPGNQHASNELQRATRELQRKTAAPSEIEQLKERARRKDVGPPLLDPSTNIPILLNFKEVELGKIFEAMGKASGINFIFDDKVALDKPMTIDIGNVTLEKALDILMLQTKNFYKVIDEYTLLVAPDTRPKRTEYEDQVIKTFYLSNADTKTVVTVLRALLQSRQVAENPDLNSVTINDTPAKVAVAERIINANDKSKGEVLIDVELLEINRTLTKTLGLDLSSKTLGLTFRSGEESLPLNNLDALKQRGNWTIGVIPSVTLDFLKSDSDTKTIAKPQLRVSEGEKAEILIGNRVPIPATSFNTSQTVGGNIVPITSFTYQNVGITVQIEPRVHHNKEVTLNVQVEISQIAGSVAGTGGASQPIIGTRQIQTVIRLRDNETNLLAGLIQREDSDSLSGVTGLTDIPGLRRIFGRTTVENRETDIILTLTPRIIRIPDITEEDLATLWVGTQEVMQLRGPTREALGAGPFATGSGGVATTSEVPDGAAAGTTRGGGSVSRISVDDEVEADRRAREAEAASQEAEPAPEAEPGGGAAPEDGGSTAGDQPPRRDDPTEPEDEPPTTPALVRLVPGQASYRVGDQVVVQVVIDNARNVGSTPFHLRFNPQVLQYLSPGEEGPFLRSDGANAVFLSNEAVPGELVVGYSRMGVPEGADGSGTLALFRFQAIGPGDCGFAFTGASIKDPQARDLPAAFNTAAVTVSP